jgi:hypothetical protein
MSSRGRNGLGEAGGLVTRVAAPPRTRAEGGERLREALAELDERHAHEADETVTVRNAIAADIATKESQRDELLSHARELTRQAEVISSEVAELQRRLDALPDEVRVRAQRALDRLSRLGRVLHADTYAVGRMLDAYSVYTKERRTWELSVRQSPEMTKDVELLGYAETSADAIAALDPVVREIIEQRVADARAKVGNFPEPTRPVEAAPIYECVAPDPEGGSIAMLAIPCGPGAMTEHQPESVLVAEVIAAMTRALLDLTDSDAPVVRTAPDYEDPLQEVVLVGARTGDAFDAELFGARLLEIFEDCNTLGIALEPIDDKELAVALAGLVQRELDTR